MMTLTLSEFERRQLTTTCKTTADRRLRERGQAILMADRKRQHAQSAQDVGVSPRTLQRWLNAYTHRGLEGLTMQWAAGRVPHIPAALVPESLPLIKQGPAGCGLDRANWTYAELATSLSQTKGIAVSATTMRTVCSKHGVRPYRPPYRSRKGDPNQPAVARQALTACKKSRGGRASAVASG
jgi:transposase